MPPRGSRLAHGSRGCNSKRIASFGAGAPLRGTAAGARGGTPNRWSARGSAARTLRTARRTEKKGLAVLSAGPLPGVCWRPQGDSNPCCRRERAVSLAGLDDGDGRDRCFGYVVGRAGLEPAALCLKGRYSTTELTARGGVRRPFLFFLRLAPPGSIAALRVRSIPGQRRRLVARRGGLRQESALRRQWASVIRNKAIIGGLTDGCNRRRGFSARYSGFFEDRPIRIRTVCP